MENASVSSFCNRIGNPLWNFSVHVYSQPEIAKESLALQNEYNANVNIILWCCWLESENLSLPTDWMDEVLINIDTVSMQTVAKLREVRRALLQTGSFTKVQAQHIKKHILKAELLVEKILLQRLEGLTWKFLVSQDNLNTIESNTDKIDLFYYLDFIGVPNARRKSSMMLNACRRRMMEDIES